MKIFIYILMLLASGLIIYNVTQLDFTDILKEDSKIALITILAGLCAITLCAILLVSKRIEENLKK